MTPFRLRKRLIKSRATHWLGSLLASFVIRMVYMTSRVVKHFPNESMPYIRGEKPAIFCFWHGRMILQPLFKPPGRGMYVLISNHNDGALITATMRWFGIGSVRGSRRKGGSNALRELFKVTEKQDNISITPDGPKGPHQVAAQGAAYVASKTGYPLIPVTFSSSRNKRLDRSWDKFMVPRPFGRVTFIVAKPILVVADAEDDVLDAKTTELNLTLDAITLEADRQCGIAS